MNIEKYQLEAMRTANPAAYHSEKDLIMNGALGLCGEAGEFADIVKKYYYQTDPNHPGPIDKDHLRKELGDIFWYIAFLSTALDFSMADILDENIAKLRARYPDGFSAERSMHRREGDI